MFLRTPPKHLYYQEKIVQDSTLQIRYLGTAGFVLQNRDRTIVLDPNITRPSLWKTLISRLEPDVEQLKQVIPQADDVLVGHAHFDHALDAPSICHYTGARLIGSPSVCNIGRAAGLPEKQIRCTEGHECIASGVAQMIGLPSIHGKIFGRIPLPGKITKPPQWPPRYLELRCGLVLNWIVKMAGLTIVHIDSADYFDYELDGVKADVLCLCAVGRQSRPNYVKTAIQKLQPRYIIPCHWDWFFTPYHAKTRCLPGVDLEGFVHEIEKEGVEPILLPFEGIFAL